MSKLLSFVFLFAALAAAVEPFPAPPEAYVDTTWNPPTGGTTWHAHTSADFTNALKSSFPGDIIILDAGSVYSGNFIVPQKTNPGNEWIYIESSALASLPAPGKRVSPSNAKNMPRITTPGVSAALQFAAGANHYRLVGLEITSSSTQGGSSGANPPSNNWSYYLIQTTRATPSDALVTFVTFDRIYAHGSDSQDVIHGVDLDGTNMAIVDSYVSDIHMQGEDAQGVLVFFSPGPYKIIDNYISASTENIMFSPADGLGTANNPYLPSDIEIRKNYLYKPPAWDTCGVHGTIPAGGKRPDGTTCPSGVNNQWVVKNNLEFKIGQRAVVTGNVLENNWVSGQVGYSLVLTARVSDAPNLWISDILFQSNILKNVDRGINTLEQSDQQGYTYFGYNKRVWIDDNLILLSTNPDDAGGHFGVMVDGGDYVAGYGFTYGLTDYIFQHNTITSIDGSPVDASFFFNEPPDVTCTMLPPSSTHNVWVLDNAMVRQPSGICGLEGMAALNTYMSDPAPLGTRFYGNVMFVPSGEQLQSWPTHNYAAAVPFTYADPAHGDYQLTKPYWTDTTDGAVSGINWNSLQVATSGVVQGPPPPNPRPTPLFTPAPASSLASSPNPVLGTHPTPPQVPSATSVRAGTAVH